MAWDSVHFVKPELGAGLAPRDVLTAIVDGFHKGLYRRKKVKPAVLEMGEQAVSGRRSLHAKVSFPEYPGTGVTVFTEKGRRRDADFVGHLYIARRGKHRRVLEYLDSRPRKPAS